MYWKGKICEMAKNGFGKMSRGKIFPAKKLRTVNRINLGAQTSALQNPIKLNKILKKK